MSPREVLAPALVAALNGCAAGAMVGTNSPCPDDVPAAAPAVASSAPAGVNGAPRAVVRRHNHLLEFGPYSAEIDATDGGRIVAFSLNGENVLVPREESPDAYGSSFWPSPQRDWRWPPPPALDRLPWATRVEGATLVLESQPDPKLGLAARQRIQADAARGVLEIELVLENRGTAPRRVAPWQNTRVRPRGLSFFPSSRPAYENSTLRLAPSDGVVWFMHDPALERQNVKLYADGEEGWVAHVDRRLMLVKLFPDIPPEQQAPSEGEVVLYVHGEGSFVEVEQQGAYAEIPPGGASSYRVDWLVRELPPGLAATPGEPALVEYVRDLVQRARG